MCVGVSRVKKQNKSDKRGFRAQAKTCSKARNRAVSLKNSKSSIGCLVEASELTVLLVLVGSDFNLSITGSY